MERVKAVLLMTVAAVIAAGCSAAPPPADDRAAGGSVPMAQAEAAYDGDVAMAERAGPVATSATDDVVAARAEQEGEMPPADVAEPSEREAQESAMPLLIYTGSVVLAIYQVDETQEAIIDAVDAMGGYVAERSSSQLTVRVPADKFRHAMDTLAEKGDVLDTNWKAQDVTDEVRDVEIRIRNARQLRERLEKLLDEADTVSEALEIESELERVTLEIERLEGQLASLKDRIAFSTIEVAFRSIEIEEVPDEEFMLPFALFDDLGLESLMRVPRRYR